MCFGKMTQEHFIQFFIAQLKEITHLSGEDVQLAGGSKFVLTSDQLLRSPVKHPFQFRIQFKNLPCS